MVWDEDEPESEQPQRRALIRRHSVRLLQQSHCKDSTQVERLIYEFVRGGPQRLQVLSNFDYTLTRSRWPNGEQVPDSFDMLLTSPMLSAAFVAEFKALRESGAELAELSALLTGVRLAEEDVDLASGQFKHALRDYAKEMLEKLAHMQVPLLINSEGLGNSILSLLRQAEALHPNLKLCSNFLQWHPRRGNVLKGLQTPPIQADPLRRGDVTRHHVLLLGQSLSDVEMIRRVPAARHVLKIGFLNENVEGNLESFMKAYDMVLTNDQSVDVPRALLVLIAQHDGSKSTNK